MSSAQKVLALLFSTAAIAGCRTNSENNSDVESAATGAQICGTEAKQAATKWFDQNMNVHGSVTLKKIDSSSYFATITNVEGPYYAVVHYTDAGGVCRIGKIEDGTSLAEGCPQTVKAAAADWLGKNFNVHGPVTLNKVDSKTYHATLNNDEGPYAVTVQVTPFGDKCTVTSIQSDK